MTRACEPPERGHNWARFARVSEVEIRVLARPRHLEEGASGFKDRYRSDVSSIQRLQIQ